jgi:hypothetical protein
MAWISHNAIWAALGCVVVFGFLAPVAGRRTSPVAATWMLSVGASIVAAVGMVVLGLMSAPLVGADDLLADREHWSGRILAHDSPTGRSVAFVAFCLLLFLLARTVFAAVRLGRSLRRAVAVSRDLGCICGTELVVLPTDAPDAYALPGRPGRIVVSRGLLRRLTPAERSAVLEHERCHLRHEHHRHVLAGSVAAAANPCLSAVPPVLSLAVERWADESAAAVCGRTVTADALSRVAALTSAATERRPVAALSAGRTAVAARVSALRQDRTPAGRPLLLGLVTVLIVGVLASALAADRTMDVFRLALAAGAHATHGVACLTHACHPHR